MGRLFSAVLQGTGRSGGDSANSVSLCLDEGLLFVGDLNPLYELDIYRGTQVGSSWNKLLARNPVKVYYSHAKAAELNKVRKTFYNKLLQLNVE